MQIDVAEARMVGGAKVRGVEDEHRVIGVLLHHCLEIGVAQADRECAGTWGGGEGIKGVGAQM